MFNVARVAVNVMMSDAVVLKGLGQANGFNPQNVGIFAAKTCLLRSVMRHNAFAARALPTPLGSLQRSPDNLAGFGGGIKRIMRGKEGNERDGKEWKIRPPAKIHVPGAWKTRIAVLHY